MTMTPQFYGVADIIARNAEIGTEYTFAQIEALAIEFPADTDKATPGSLVHFTSVQDALRGLLEYGLFTAGPLGGASGLDPNLIASWGFTCVARKNTTVTEPPAALAYQVPWTYSDTTEVGVFPV